MAGLGIATIALPEWTPARPDYDWQFPRDHWSHPGYQTEWWYFTGHLTPDGTAEPRFGYQFTIFRVGLTPELPDLDSPWAARDLVMGHAAVTDLATGEHVFSEVVYRAAPMLGGFAAPPDPLLAWSRAPPGTDGRWILTWNGEAFDFAMRDARRELAFALSTRPERPRIFQGPNGYSRKGHAPTAASLYYSFTRLATTGTIAVGGDTFRVRGRSWMDKEFGSNQLDADQVGWDWFSLQLADGRDLMVYVLRNAAGATDYGRGTIVGPEGSVRYLTPDVWDLEATDTWRSPDTDAEYPSRWRLRLPGEDLNLVIVPLLDAQENVSALVTGLRYWEGAVMVRDAAGRRVGRGYVELTGYGEGVRLPL